MRLDHRTTISCSYIEGMKTELISYRNLFPTFEHAMHQALAIANSITPYSHAIFVLKTKDGFFVTENFEIEQREDIVGVVL